MKDVVTMAGFFTSHAVWNVSSGDQLIPLMGTLSHSGTKDMIRFMAEPELAEKAMDDMSDSVAGMAFIQDGLVALDTGKTDALIVTIRFQQESHRCIRLLIPYRPVSHDDGFLLNTLQVSALDGFDETDVSWIIDSFFIGLEQHTEGRTVWSRYNSAAQSLIGKAAQSANTRSKAKLSVELSEHEFKVLKRAPFLVFYFVATADGDVNKKEMMAFLKVLSGERLFKLPLLDFLIQGVQSEVQILIKEMATHSMDYTGELGVIRLIVDARLSEDKALQFKNELYDMGLSIAEATSGFLGLGAKIGNEEAAALDAIAASFGLPS
ncbi:MAG: hypothetical protein AAGF06_00675 [Pseudomonadota bacterium]